MTFDASRDYKQNGRRVRVSPSSKAFQVQNGRWDNITVSYYEITVDGRSVPQEMGLFADEEKFDERLRAYVNTLINMGAA